MKDCSYVQKDAMNDRDKYTYASAGAVLEKVNEALVKHGIATVTRSKVINEWERINSKGTTLYYKEVEVEITLIDTDSGEERVIAGLGCGMDVSDKAVMKAQTAAVKYAWMMSLQIATGDDPEAEAPPVDEKGDGPDSSAYLVQEIVEAPNRAKITLCDQNSGEIFDAVVKNDYPIFKAQKISKGHRITCQFGQYNSPKGKQYKEILAPRRVA